MRHAARLIIGLLPILGLLAWLGNDPGPLPANDPAAPPPPADRPRIHSHAATRLNCPDGFQATLFADDTLAHNAYCLAAAPSGPIAVSGPGYIRILADRNQDGRAELLSTFAHGPQSGAQGLCFDGSDLLAVGDAGLLRYRDENGDFQADAAPTCLLPIKTGGEHYAHAIRRGTDGRWYLMCGNMTFDEPPRITASDSPVTDPRAGLLLRFDYSADDNQVRNLAVVAHGMRNAYDFDFLRSGDIVTYDSDGEREISLPWYRPTRVFRLLPGSDAGWFSRSWKFPSEFPETPQTLADLGRGSPTGVLVLRDSRWPEPFDNAVFVCDWTFGRVVAIPLDDRDQPGEPIDFLTASGTIGFAPTDIVQAVDGALIISSGGRGTTGRLFRIVPDSFKDKTKPHPTIASTAGTLRQELSAHPTPARFQTALANEEPLLRRVALEVLSEQTLSADEFASVSAQILSGLTDDEPNVRKAAMQVVAKLSATNQESLSRWIGMDQHAARIRMELARNGGNAELGLELLDLALASIESNQLKPDETFDTVRLAQIALGDLSGGDDTFAGYTARAELADYRDELSVRVNRCLALFPTDDEPIDRELVRLLAMLASDNPLVRDELLARITPDSHPTYDLHHLFAIARQRAAWTTAHGEAVAAALLAIDEKLADRKLNRDLYWETRLGDLVAALSESNPQIHKQIVASSEFGRPGQIPLLATAPASVRARAAEVFLSREKPSSLNDWTTDVVALIAELSTDSARNSLREAYQQPHLRSAALRGLARHPHPADRSEFVTGLDALDVETVASCLQALDSLDLKAEMAEIAALARAVGRFDRNRQEYALRGRIVARLQQLTGKTFDFELGEAGYRPQRDPVARWAEYARALDPQSTAASDVWTAFLPRLEAAAELEGNARRGGEIFRDLACDRCHAGGAVGPDLAGVANRFSRGDLFRALVEPDRDIPSRYRGILIQTTRGKIVTGLVAYESTDGLTLKDGEETWRIESDEIELRQPLDTSLMPRGLLREATSQELADLAAYLERL